MANPLATLLIAVVADTRGVTAGLANGARSMATFQKGVTGSATAASKALGSIVPLGAAAAGVAVAAFAAKSVSAALDFDRAFARIGAISDAAAEDIGAMREQTLKLAGETAQAPTELADALFFLSSAGLEASQVMPALEASAKASAVGLGETADVANIVASALNAYSKTGLTAAAATDVLVAAVREGRAEPEEFANALGRILPIASTVGVTFDQVAASMAALSNIGLDVNEGVTAMRGVLQAIAAPGSQAAAAMDELGLSSQQLLDAISEDGIIGALRMLDEAAKSQTDTQAGYNDALRKVIPNIRSLTGVLGLTVQGAKKVDEVYQDVAESTGDLGEAFQTTAESDAFKVQKALNDISIAGQKLAADALPGLVKVLEVVAEIANVLAAPFETPEIDPIDPALVSRQVEYNQAVHAMAEAFITGQIGAGELSAAQRNLSQNLHVGRGIIDQDVDAILAAVDAQDQQARTAEAAADGQQRLAAGLDVSTGAASRSAAAHRDAAAAMEEELAVSLQLAGGLLGVLASADQLQDSQAEVNKLQQQGKRGTEEYRDASLQLLQDTVALKEGLLDYASELDGAGQSSGQVANTIREMGREMGLSKADVNDLLNDVRKLTGNLSELDKQDPNVKITAKDNATPTIVTLEERLRTLVAHDYELRIHAVTTGGSTAFDLIDHLEKELEDLTAETYEVVINAGVQPPEMLRMLAKDTKALDKVLDTLGSSIDDVRSDLEELNAEEKKNIEKINELEEALDKLKEQRLAAKELSAAFSEFGRKLEKLAANVQEFGDAIRSAFDIDLVGGLSDTLNQFNEATEQFLEEQKKFEEGGGIGTAPVPPDPLDLTGFLQDQVAGAEAFAKALTDLQAAGLSQQNLQDLASQGIDALPLAQALLANPQLISALNDASKAIAKVAGDTTKSLIEKEFGPAIDRVAERLRKLERSLERFNDLLDNINDKGKGGAGGGGGNNNGGGGGPGGGVASAAQVASVLPPTVINVYGDVLTEGQLVEKIDEALRRKRLRNGNLLLDRR